MRPAYLLLLAAVLLAPVPARADPPPRVSVRLDYQRGEGAAACPGEEALRDEVARRMGYDPFDTSATVRLVVVVAWQSDPKKRRFEAHVDRYAPNGDKTWDQDYPGGTTCASFIASLASEIRAAIVPAPTVAKPLPLPELPPAPPPELPALAPLPAPELPAVQAPPPAPATPGRPAGHDVALGVAIASYAVTAVFTGLGIAYTVKAQAEQDTAAAQRAQVLSENGNTGCLPGGATAMCKTLLADAQSFDAVAGTRNAFWGLAGATATLGVVATVWSLSISRPKQTTVNVGPANVTIRGCF